MLKLQDHTVSKRQQKRAYCIICLYYIQKQAKLLKAVKCQISDILGRSGAVTTRRIIGCFWGAGCIPFPDLSVGYTSIL